MAKITDKKIQELFAPHLHEGETFKHGAFGVKQPNMLLIIGRLSNGRCHRHCRPCDSQK